jgi:hypothetical protein
MHISVAQTKMMARFVDQDVADKMLERLAFFAPFGEDRLPEQPNPVWQRPACVNAPLANWNPLIDSGQLEWMIDAHFGKQGVVGIFVDLQYDMLEMGSERFGQSPHRLARDCLDFLG